MLSDTERQSISRASRGGVDGVAFEHDHLKALHLLVPLRNVITYVTYCEANAFPVCFLANPLAGKKCACVRHGKEKLEQAMKHRVGKCHDRHS